MEQDTIDLLTELVAIDSQNPSLVPGAAGESQIAAYVADWAKGAGLTAEIMEETGMEVVRFRKVDIAKAA